MKVVPTASKFPDDTLAQQEIWRQEGRDYTIIEDEKIFILVSQTWIH
tara:strand:+ start:2103 stop:2243 length:141 start_codon:yes stop_codon:yes gene_type:complete